jgi:HK97 family phage prohead protease
MHKRKTAPIHGFKALVDEGPGVFEAVVSVFGNVDLAGDRVLPGAFAGSLDRWKSSGDPIPVIFSHQWDSLDAHVGTVLEAKELLPGAPEIAGTPIEANGGLWIKGRLDVEDPEEAFARRLWKRLLNRRIKEFSFAYDVLAERTSSDGANDLVELDVIEVGPTLKGMNPATELLLAKSLERLRETANPDHVAFAAGVIENLRALGDDDLADRLAKSTPAHAFIPGAEDATRCEVCGLTRSTVGHLHTLSTGADGAKAVVDLAGSVEERQARLIAAGFDVIDVDQANGGLYELALEGTFDDRVVFRLEGWNDPVGGGRFFECAIVSDADPVELGDPVEVAVEGVTRPKAALRRSTKAKVAVATVVDDGDGSGKSTGNREDRESGNREDLKTRTGEGSSTGEATRLLLELDELELQS